VKKMVALQLRARMQKAGITPTGLAHAMKTSRAAVARLLDPANESMTLETLTRAARAIRADVFVCLIDKGAVCAPRKATALGKRGRTVAPFLLAPEQRQSPSRLGRQVRPRVTDPDATGAPFSARRPARAVRRARERIA
jgi:hypothetical protein